MLLNKRMRFEGGGGGAGAIAGKKTREKIQGKTKDSSCPAAYNKWYSFQTVQSVTSTDVKPT